jgi:3'-5' exoribonuclease
MKAEFLLEQLKIRASAYGVTDVCSYLFDDPKFLVWSGSSKPHQHHYGKGGLIQHTYEVVMLCSDNADFFTDPKFVTVMEQGYKIDKTELFLAALFHDAGKLYDYEPVNHAYGNPTYDAWGSTEHKRYIHHISRSAIMWSEAARRYINDITFKQYHDKVLHAILAHHGCREAGSPVAPKSRVAWLVTLCDNMSARMYDADTLDIVEHYEGR